jgi:hypothetical protein
MFNPAGGGGCRRRALRRLWIAPDLQRLTLGGRRFGEPDSQPDRFTIAIAKPDAKPDIDPEPDSSAHAGSLDRPMSGDGVPVGTRDISVYGREFRRVCDR